MIRTRVVALLTVRLRGNLARVMSGGGTSVTDTRTAWQKSLLHKIGSAFTTAGYLCVILCAVSWEASPSRTMSQALDPEWTLIYSIALGSFGAVAFVGRLLHRNVVEGTFSILAGVLIWCWSLIVLNLGYTTEPEVLQAGWALMGFAGLAVGWGFIEVAWAKLSVKYEALLLEELTRRVRARAQQGG